MTGGFASPPFDGFALCVDAKINGLALCTQLSVLEDVRNRRQQETLRVACGTPNVSNDLGEE